MLNRIEKKEIEKIKSKEVFTDDCAVVGPEDNFDFLEALPLSCIILTASLPEKKIAGMAHFSLNPYEDDYVLNLTRELKRKLESKKIDVSKCELILFGGSDILFSAIKKALKEEKMSEPHEEYINADQGDWIRIDKNTGEFSFFYL